MRAKPVSNNPRRRLLLDPRPQWNQIVEAVDWFARRPGDSAEQQRAEQRVVEGPGAVGRGAGEGAADGEEATFDVPVSVE